MCSFQWAQHSVRVEPQSSDWAMCPQPQALHITYPATYYSAKLAKYPPSCRFTFSERLLTPDAGRDSTTRRGDDGDSYFATASWPTNVAALGSRQLWGLQESRTGPAEAFPIAHAVTDMGACSADGRASENKKACWMSAAIRICPDVADSDCPVMASSPPSVTSVQPLGERQP